MPTELDVSQAQEIISLVTETLLKGKGARASVRKQLAEGAQAHIARMLEATREAGEESERNRQKHNGYTNYETWCVSTWISNEEALQKHWLNAARTLKTKHDADSIVSVLAQQLKDEIEELRYKQKVEDMWSDLLGAAISDVDWYELAQHLLAD